MRTIMKSNPPLRQPSAILPKGNFIANIGTLQGCLNLEANASRNGFPDLAVAARHRYVQLAALAELTSTDAERAAYECLCACELANLRKYKRRVPCNRTRSAAKRLGIIKTIERVVDRPKQSSGYVLLVELGLETFTFERVVLKYRQLFSQRTVRRAWKRVHAQKSMTAQLLN